MSEERVGSLRIALTKLWLISPERLWLFSIALQRRGRWRAAFAVKQLGTILYHNSLSPGASVGADVALGHYSHGIVVNGNVEIGNGVKIWHNVTLTAGRPARVGGKRSSGPPSRIVIDDAVKIGTNAVVIAPRGQTLRIGRAAKIGAGAIVTRDVPAGATALGPSARVILAGAGDSDSDSDSAGGSGSGSGSDADAPPSDAELGSAPASTSDR